MNIKEYKDDFKTRFNWEENISIGKNDNTKEKSITFYNSKRTSNNIGMKNSKQTKIKRITIFLRYGKNKEIADNLANKVQEFYKESFIIGDINVIPIIIYDEPIDLGTDEKNNYEYSIEVDFIENERRK